MMIMAQHPQQPRQQKQPPQLKDPKPKQPPQPPQCAQETGPLQSTQINSNPPIKSAANGQQLQLQQQIRQHQQEQDGKRALIKNQLYLIEQLQLENANLRNERDQLQLENEELKFQLQMISSSNILSQPGATFSNDQQLEPLVANNATKINGNHHNSLASNLRASLTGSSSGAPGTTATNQVKLLATPLRQQAKQLSGADNQQQVPSLTSTITDNGQFNTAIVRPASTVPDAGTKRAPAGSAATSAMPLVVAANRKSLGGKSTSLTAFNVRAFPAAPQSRTLPDDDEQRIKLVEQCYGDGEQVRAAAIIIQRAFRKYQICKRFLTITEQLRHTYQSAAASATTAAPAAGAAVSGTSSSQASSRPVSSIDAGKPSAESLPYHASGATRAAAWESLSYAASRLASSATAAAAAAAAATATSAPGTKQQQQAAPANGAIKVQPPTSQFAAHQQQQLQQPVAPAGYNMTTGGSKSVTPSEPSRQTLAPSKQDPVVAAAINFQQLESIRKRQYRVGLNIFNKSPEKGVSFLVAHSFIDSSPPYTKSSTSYYHSNQLHFIDNKQHLVMPHQQQQQQQQQQQHQQGLSLSVSSNLQQLDCQSCCEEENLKRNVAHFLLHRKGLAKEKIGLYFGNLQSKFNQDVLKYYLQELDFHGLQIDLALRKFLSTFRLPGEAQKIERIVDCFAQRYVQCQQQQQQQSVSCGNVTNVATTVAVPQNQSQVINHRQQQQQPQPQQVATSQQIQSQTQQQIALNNNRINNLILLSKDEIFILTFAIIMLNTDLHSPSLKPTSRMSAPQFVNNLRGVFKSQTINESDLIEIYERVKANQITTTPDHVTHVLKVQQGLVVTNFQKKEIPNLCVPHRRLVCFCRLFEVYDVSKKERVGQHQREIFLFNDLLLVTKLARRVRANSAPTYAYRQCISLQGLYVQLFQSPHYNFGIRLCQRSNNETLIMFNARNELDQSRFVEDLGESIAEMDEMESIKAHNIIETMHFKHLERLRRHAMLHNTTTENIQSANHGAVDDTSKQAENKLINNCDNRITSDKQISGFEDRQQQQQQQPSSPPQQRQSQTTHGLAAATTSSLAGRIQSKFSSMLNLSSVAESTKSDDSDSSEPKPKPSNSSSPSSSSGRNPTLFAQASSSRNQEPGVRNDQQQAAAGNQQRRNSTSSVHSLDSGLFLSRDVSPNQSS